MSPRWTQALWIGAVSVAALWIPSDARADWQDLPPNVRNEVAGAVAQVGRVWPDDTTLVEFHGVLANRFKDTPPLAELKAKDTWLSVITSRSVRFPGVFVVRSESSQALKRGDIVRVRIVNYRKVDSYFQQSAVESVLCRAGDQGYDECAKANLLSWTLKSGEVISR